jgi:GAF domain-containing protein
MNAGNRLLPSDKPPDRRRLHYATLYFRQSVYMCIIGLIIAASISSLNFRSIIVASSWVFLLICYFYLRRLLVARNHWLMKEEGVIYHGFAGILGVSLTYIALELSGYGTVGLDPLNLWLLILPPLGLVSRYGRTKDWARLFILAIILQLCTRFVWVNFVELSTSARQAWPLTAENIYYYRGIANLSTVIQICVIALLSFGIHLTFRWRRNLLIQADIELQVINKLSSGVTIDNNFTQAAEAIHKLDKSSTDYFPFVYIMGWNERSKRLRVLGGAGKQKTDWENIELKYNEGITGRAFAKGETINEPDVSKLTSDEYVCPKGFEHVRSELATPILYQEKKLGVLTVQSERTNIFDKHDERLLKALSGSLGIAFANALNLDQRVANAHKLTQEILKAGEDYQNRAKWYDAIFEAGKIHLNGDSFILFRLAPGTNYPIRPSLVRPKSIQAPLKKTWPIPDGSYFWKLLKQWEPVFMNQIVTRSNAANSDSDLWALDFLQETNTQSLVFIPIGLYERIAFMFILYRSKQTFGDVDKLAIATFAAALESSYRQLDSNQGEVHRWGSFIHEGLTPQIHNLNAQLDQVKKNKNNPDAIPFLVEAAKQLVQQTGEQITLATIGLGYNYDPNTHTLKEGLNKAAGRLALGREKRPTTEISGTELVEDEDPTLIELLYRLATEAMANAVKHGEATVIRVHFQRTKQAIFVEIHDDGKGLEKEHRKDRPYGIYSLRKFLQRAYDVELCIENLPNHGVRVAATFPLIPNDEKVYSNV